MPRRRSMLVEPRRTLRAAAADPDPFLSIALGRRLDRLSKRWNRLARAFLLCPPRTSRCLFFPFVLGPTDDTPVAKPRGLDTDVTFVFRLALSSRLGLHDLPIGVFADDLALAKRIEVAASDFHPRAIAGDARERPLRDAGLGVLIHEVLVLTIVDVGQSAQSASP